MQLSVTLRLFGKSKHLWCQIMLVGPNCEAIRKESKLSSLARDLIESKVIELKGVVADPHVLYTRSSGYVQISDSGESFPNSIFEAKVHSLPVVVTGVGGIDEFIDRAVDKVIPIDFTHKISNAINIIRMNRLNIDPY